MAPVSRDETVVELRSRLRELESVADASIDVEDLEPQLESLLSWLTESNIDRQAAEQVLIEQASTWPLGSVEATEFTMRELQWPAVRGALLRQLDSEADFRIKDQSRRVLEVYEPTWTSGEIYSRYR